MVLAKQMLEQITRWKFLLQAYRAL
jgi:hypothetical protein